MKDDAAVDDDVRLFISFLLLVLVLLVDNDDDGDVVKPAAQWKEDLDGRSLLLLLLIFR